MQNDKVSVIVPVYNCEQYLEQGIESLINQTHRDLEIILVDDCSTDGSLSILERYAQQDSRIKIIKMEHNSGVSVCRNAGLDAVTGGYVAFMDADDWYELDAFEVMLKALKSDTSHGTVFCAGRFYDEKKDKTSERALINKGITAPSSKTDFLNNPELMFKVRREIWARLYRFDGIIKSLRFKPNIPIGEDEVYTVEILFNADNIIY